MSSRDTNEIPRRQLGGGPIVWIVGLLLFGALAATVAAFALWSLVSEPASTDTLTEWGIIERGQPVIAYADLSDEQDLSDGCVLTTGRLIAWEDRQVVSTVPLSGAEVQVQGTDVVVQGGGYTATCPFDEVQAAHGFANAVAREARPPAG